MTNKAKDISQNVGDVTKKVESISKEVDSLVSDKQPVRGKKIMDEKQFCFVCRFYFSSYSQKYSPSDILFEGVMLTIHVDLGRRLLFES